MPRSISPLSERRSDAALLYLNLISNGRRGYPTVRSLGKRSRPCTGQLSFQDDSDSGYLAVDSTWHSAHFAPESTEIKSTKAINSPHAFEYDLLAELPRKKARQHSMARKPIIVALPQYKRIPETPKGRDVKTLIAHGYASPSKPSLAQNMIASVNTDTGRFHQSRDPQRKIPAIAAVPPPLAMALGGCEDLENCKPQARASSGGKQQKSKENEEVLAKSITALEVAAGILEMQDSGYLEPDHL